MALTILFDEEWLAKEEGREPDPKAMVWEKFETDTRPKRGRKPSRHASKTKYKKQHLVTHSTPQKS